jgi:hypothetical protein
MKQGRISFYQKKSTKGDEKGEFPIGIPPTCQSLTLILIIEVAHLS